MPLSFRAALAAALLVAPSVASAQSAAPIGLTIYNDGRVLVRRTVPVQVPKGASSRSVALGAFDPATLFSLDEGVTLLGVRAEPQIDEGTVLRRALGQKIQFWRPREQGGADTVTATVLGVDPLRFQLADGRVTFAAPGTAIYPAQLAGGEAGATLALRADAARDALRLGYFTGDAGWQTSYQVILGRSDARVSGMAVVNAGALRADGAEVQLLAGQVNRAGPQPMAGMVARDEVTSKARYAAPMEAATVQRVGEFHLYSIPGRLDLVPGQTVSAALFEPARVSYEKNYVAPSALPYFGVIPQMPDTMETPVEVRYTLKRPAKSDFGDRPLPGGVARLYQADDAGRLQLVGEAGTDHTPAGQDLTLSAGTAFDLTAKRVQTAYTSRRDSVRAGVWRTTITAAYSVSLANAGDEDVVIDVRESRGGEWSVTQSSVPAEKLSSATVRFRVKVPARGSALLTYAIKASW